MDIIRAFQKNEVKINITIKGTYNDPLFRLSDIATILDIKFFHNSVKDFNNTEKKTHKIYTTGGEQDVIFLTEKGLYKLLFRSNKPMAKEFTDWACDVLKELRINSSNELQNQIDLIKKEKEQEIEYIHKQNQKKTKEDLIEKHDKKKCLYLIYIPTHNLMKFGITIDIRRRFADHCHDISNDIDLMYVLDSAYNSIVENNIKSLCLDKNDILFKRRVNMTFQPNKIYTELIKIDNKFTHEDFWNKVLFIEKNLNKDEEFNVLETKIKTLEKEIENLKNNNLQQIKIKESIIREKNLKIKRLERMNIPIKPPLFLYNINNKTITEFPSMNQAQTFLDTTLLTIRHYIDKHKQFKGYIIWSKTFDSHWMVPDNFKFHNCISPTTQTIFIKRTNKITKEITYYNSITEASLYLQQEIDNNPINGETESTILLKKAIGEYLRGFATKKVIVNKYLWNKMNDIGFIINSNGTTTLIDEVNEEVKENSEENSEEGSETKKENQNERIIPVVVRNILTKKDHFYPEGLIPENKRKHNIFYTIDQEKYIDKPRLYKIWSIRTLDGPIWEPPDGFITDIKSGAARLAHFIKVKNPDQTINYFDNMNILLNYLFANKSQQDKKKIACSINKLFHRKFQRTKNPIHKITKELVNYEFSRIKTCGQFIYTNGEIEKLKEDIVNHYDNEPDDTLVGHV